MYNTFFGRLTKRVSPPPSAFGAYILNGTLKRRHRSANLLEPAFPALSTLFALFFLPVPRSVCVCARACVLHAIIPERAPTRTFTRALACTSPLLVVVGMHPHPHLVVHTTFAYAQHAPHNRNDHPPPAGDKVVCKFRIKDAHIPHIVACVRRHIFGPQQSRAEQSGFNYSVQIVNAHTDLNQSNNGERHTDTLVAEHIHTHTRVYTCSIIKCGAANGAIIRVCVCKSQCAECVSGQAHKSYKRI